MFEMCLFYGVVAGFIGLVIYAVRNIWKLSFGLEAEEIKSLSQRQFVEILDSEGQVFNLVEFLAMNRLKETDYNASKSIWLG